MTDTILGEVPPTQPTRVADQQIVEIVSDAGEGAQTAGTTFGGVCSRMGNGLWTVEIIPAEIEPPRRSREGASGIRIRFGADDVTNMGDSADVVVAFNEQVLYGRIDQGALRAGSVLFIDDHWASSSLPGVPESYAAALGEFREAGYDVREVPIDAQTREVTDNPRRGKNMWVLGLLCAYFDRDLDIAMDMVAQRFAKKGDKVRLLNQELVRLGYRWGVEHIPDRVQVPSRLGTTPRVAMNGNAAIALGTMAAGFELISMYPITPATSASHYLAAMFHEAGGFVHQAEDEIAAIGFAIGASYAGKTALTVTSGPGLALKTEMIGLSVMAEIPLVVVDVQRGGPSTGLPTKVEQGDLLATLFGQPGDAPKVVLAPATIGECFHMMVTARKLAELFRTPVFVLTDANLATGTSTFPYPEPDEAWLSPPVDQSDWDREVEPYAWDAMTGLSKRPIPGQKEGQYVLTGLAHDRNSKVAYASAINQQSMEMRSRKLRTLAQTLSPPKVFGKSDGELLVVGWGSTQGAIEEAVGRLQDEGLAVSAVHLRFLSPMEPGLPELFAKFRQVMTVEINYGDDPALGSPRRYAQLAMLLRSATLVDVDSWSRVPGQPLPPGMIERALRERLAGGA